jgi:hypothetical protein
VPNKDERVASLEVRIVRLEAERDIRSVIDCYGRAIDRNDAALLESLFHPDAVVHYGPDVFEGIAVDFIPAVLAVQAAMIRTQHLLGQSRIEIGGDQAWAETYSHAVHLIARDAGEVEFVSGARYLDRLERRDGRWRIAMRQVVVDWLREMRADESLFGRLNGPPRGGRGMTDPSVSFFPF